MKTRFATFLFAAALAVGAQAQTLRWSSQGDLQTLDPHSQNELLTNSINGQVYDTLVMRDKKLGLAPGLATEWTQVSPTLWRMKLRPNVKFHDGSPFTADDVVFSFQRASNIASNFRVYATAMGTARKVDDLTVEFQLKDFDPIFLQHATTIYIMNKAWAEKNNAAVPIDFKNKEEKYTNLHANGTGPYMLVSRQPDTKTVFKRNPNYWGGKLEGNVEEIVYTPIKNDATRTAALISGEIDFVLDPAPQDVARLRQTPGVKVIDGLENRIVFIGMDQQRDELLYSNVKGKNPFKDLRVRKALYYAIDIETLKRTVMRGQAIPTGVVMPSPLGDYNDPDIEKRLPFDLAKARELMKEAGYPNGFEVQLDCPNNRYINDQSICEALSAMWAKLGMKVNVLAQPRATYFPKAEKQDVSMYMLGWGGAITDAETTFTPVLHSRGDNGVGYYNYGGYKDAKLDQLIEASSKEPDGKKREQLIKAALHEHKDQVLNIPLHRQVIPWAARSNVDVVHRADNWLEVQWVKMGPSAK
jgi:peptide/nickel transport system substrate-binding protein